MGNQRERPPPTSHCSSKECGKTRRNSLNDEIQSLPPNSSLIALRFPGVCPLSPPPPPPVPLAPLETIKAAVPPPKSHSEISCPSRTHTEPTEPFLPDHSTTSRKIHAPTTPLPPLSPPGGPHQAAGRGGTALLRATDCPLAAQCAPGASQTVLRSPHRHQLRRPLLRG
jgi:hypothetical protein